MIDIHQIKTYSLKKRPSKVSIRNFACVCKGKSFNEFYHSLPQILAAADLKSVVDAIVSAYRRKKTILLMMGAHVIKCGLTPLVIDLIKKDIISCVALNGAGIIHDFEIAYLGKTSEDVARAINNGSFGMACETAHFLNSAINEGAKNNLGLGKAVAEAIKKKDLPFRRLSVLYNCLKKDIPVTVHVAVGTDIIHQHPNFDASLTGKASGIDFYTLVEVVSKLQDGVVINFGSAVILPEIFLKALNMARNLGHKITKLTTANFDMLYHYRPAQNVVSRPTLLGGKGYYLIGHHELMLPLLYRALIERLNG